MLTHSEITSGLCKVFVKNTKMEWYKLAFTHLYVHLYIYGWIDYCYCQNISERNGQTKK